MRWPWQRRRRPVSAAIGSAWVPALGGGPWRTWYAECCDAVLAFERVSAALPARLRAPVDGLADQLTPLLDAAQRTSELGAYLDQYGPWPDPGPRALLAEDLIADLSDRLPPECATTALYDLLQHQRRRLEGVADELTRLAATARENPAATDVAGWLAALGTGVTEASRAGYTAGTLEPRPVPGSPVQHAERPAPTSDQPDVEPAPLGWYVASTADRIVAGLPEVPDVTGDLADRYLAAEWAVLRYYRALGSTPPESPAGAALADGWPVMMERLARVGRLTDLTARAPSRLPAPRRRGPHRTRYPAGARHLHNLHRELVTLVSSAEAAVRVAVAVALADWAEPSTPGRPPADPATTVEQALAALATALAELAAATPTDH